MSLELLNYVSLSQTALSAIVAFLALIQFKSREMYIKLIGLAFLLGFIANSTAFLCLRMGYREYMNIPQTIYDSIIICVFSLIYYHALNKRFGRKYLTISLLTLLFAFVNFFLMQKYSINSYNKFVASFIVIGYSITYFYRLMVELPSTHLQRMPMFWFNSAFLIYYAGAFILFVYTSYIVNVLKNNLLTYWVFHNCLSIFEHFIVLIGLYYDLAKPGSDK